MEKELISTRAIMGWLERYEELSRLEAPCLTDMPGGNTGKKNADGISNAVINKAMLSAGLKGMSREAPLLHFCCMRRWISPWTLGVTLHHLENMSKDKYYYRCEYAVEYLYYHVNHLEDKRFLFLDKLKRKKIL